MRKLSAEHKVGRTTIQRIVRGYLALKSLKLRPVHKLSVLSRKRRVEKCRALLRRHAKPEMAEVIFSDEKIFTVEQTFNRQNDRILASDVNSIPGDIHRVQRSQHPAQLHIWGAVSKNYRSRLVFIPEGSNINADIYRDLVLEGELTRMMQSTLQNQLFTYQQDGARAHTAITTQNWCRQNLPDFISKEEWPAYSPDLNPLDCFVWGVLEGKVCAKAHNSVECLKRSLQRAWDQIPQTQIRAACDKFKSRLRLVIQNGGGYFE